MFAFQLKHELGEEWLAIDRDEIGVTDDLWCDANAFEQAIVEDRLADAMDLYRGPFLSAFDAGVVAFEHWVTRRGSHFSVQLREGMRTLISRGVAADEAETALRHARRWAEVAPEEDEAQHRVIELLAAAGHRNQALQQYDLYCRSLAIEKLQPLDETKQLAQRIRRGEALGPLTTMLPADAQADEPSRTRRIGGARISGPRLVRIAMGGVEAESYLLTAGETRIGRTGCEIAFPADPRMEDVHASVTVNLAGRRVPRLTLSDESDSGVYVRIREAWPLGHGDRFRAGAQWFRFEEAGS